MTQLEFWDKQSNMLTAAAATGEAASQSSQHHSGLGTNHGSHRSKEGDTPTYCQSHCVPISPAHLLTLEESALLTGTLWNRMEFKAGVHRGEPPPPPPRFAAAPSVVQEWCGLAATSLSLTHSHHLASGRLAVVFLGGS